MEKTDNVDEFFNQFLLNKPGKMIIATKRCLNVYAITKHASVSTTVYIAIRKLAKIKTEKFIL